MSVLRINLSLQFGGVYNVGGGFGFIGLRVLGLGFRSQNTYQYHFGVPYYMYSVMGPNTIRDRAGKAEYVSNHPDLPNFPEVRSLPENQRREPTIFL